MIAVHTYTRTHAPVRTHLFSHAQTRSTHREERTVYHVTARRCAIAERERGNKKKKTENLLIPVGADASRLVVLGTIIVGTVVEGAVPLSHRSAPPLVHKVPVEARERPVLRAFALYEEGTLVDAELLQVSGMRIHRARHYFSPVGCRALPSTLPRRAASLSLSFPRHRRSYMYFCGS